MNSLNIIVQQYFLHTRAEWLIEFMYLVSTFFELTIYTLLATVLIGILIYFIRGKKYAVLFGSCMTFGALVSYVLKEFFNVPRPPDAVYSAFGSSFPSYHAVIVTILFSMLIFIFDGYFHGVWRKIFNGLCVFAVILVSFSRLYLGVHWLSDVLAGIFLGFVISYISVLIFRKAGRFKLKSSTFIPQI